MNMLYFFNIINVVRNFNIWMHERKDKRIQTFADAIDAHIYTDSYYYINNHIFHLFVRVETQLNLCPTKYIIVKVKLVNNY
jgi:hypothetical protein